MNATPSRSKQRRFAAPFFAVAAHSYYNRAVNSKAGALPVFTWLAVGIGGGVAIIVGAWHDKDGQVLTGLGFLLAGWASLTSTWTDEDLQRRIAKLEALHPAPAPAPQPQKDDPVLRAAAAFETAMNIVFGLAALVVVLLTLVAIGFVVGRWSGCL